MEEFLKEVPVKVLAIEDGQHVSSVSSSVGRRRSVETSSRRSAHQTTKIARIAVLVLMRCQQLDWRRRYANSGRSFVVYPLAESVEKVARDGA